MRVLTIDTGRLGALILRDPPTEYPDPDTGEVRYRGRIVVPGEYEPQDIRLRVAEPYTSDSMIVACEGRVIVTAWYQPGRGRNTPGRSEVTLSCDRLVSSTDMPELVGRNLPAVFPDAVTYLGRDGDQVKVMLPREHYDADGSVVSVHAAAVDTACVPGSPVELVNVTGRVQLVDREDVGRYAKSRVILAAGACRPVASGNGRGRRGLDPVLATAEAD